MSGNENDIKIECPFCKTNMHEITNVIPKFARGKKRYWACNTECKTTVIKEL